MASTSTSTTQDWKMKEWQDLQNILDEQSDLCEKIIEKRQERTLLEQGLAATDSDLKSLEKRHKDLEVWANRISKRIQNEPSIANFHALPATQVDTPVQDYHGPQPQHSVRRDPTPISRSRNNRRNNINATTQNVHEDPLLYPPNSPATNRTSVDSPPTNRPSPLNGLSSARTLVDRREELSPARVHFPSSPRSPTDQTCFFEPSPRNSDSKAATPFSAGFRRRTQSLLSGIAARLPFIPSPTEPDSFVPQQEKAPIPTFSLPRRTRKPFKRV